MYSSSAVVWSCLPFIRSGQNHLARHSERGKKTRQMEKEVGRQHLGMDRPGVCQVPESSGEQGKMEETGCKIICDAPTTLMVKGQVMLMVNSYSLQFSLSSSLSLTCMHMCRHPHKHIHTYKMTNLKTYNNAPEVLSQWHTKYGREYLPLHWSLLSPCVPPQTCTRSTADLSLGKNKPTILLQSRNKSSANESSLQSTNQLTCSSMNQPINPTQLPVVLTNAQVLDITCMLQFVPQN